MSTETQSSGIGVVGLLGVIFVTLKLCGVIGWSWWWVTCPFWGGLVLFLSVLLLIGIGYLLYLVGKVMFRKKPANKHKQLQDIFNK